MYPFLKWNIVSTTAVGLKPYEFKNKFSKNLHKIYCDWFLICFVTFILTQYYEIYNLIQDDILALVDNLGVSLLYTSTLMKVFVFRSKRTDDLLKSIKEIEKRILCNNEDDDCKDIYWYYVNYNNKVIKICVTISAMTIFPYYIAAALDDAMNPPEELYSIINDTVIYNSRPLPLSSWFPFDKYKYYHLTYGLQCFAVTIGGSYVYATDVFTYALLIFATVPIKVLQHQFKTFRKEANRIHKLNGSTTIHEEDAVHAVIGNCVEFHKIIIKYVEDLNITIRWLMLFDFGIAAIQMAMLAFQTITGNMSTKQIFAFEYLGAMLTQLFLCYWHADDVFYESMKIADSLWDTDWYRCNTKIKRSFVFIIFRSQRPLKLTVGQFYTMSVQTALTIIRATYSCVALLHQVYNREKI